MKVLFFLILYLGICASTQSAGIADAKMKEIVRKMVSDCTKMTSGPSVADSTLLKENKAPTSSEGMCFLECMYNKVGIIRDGQFSKSGLIVALTPTAIGNFGKAKRIRTMANLCEKQIKPDSNKCVVASSVFTCMMANGGEEFSLKFGDVQA